MSVLPRASQVIVVEQTKPLPLCVFERKGLSAIYGGGKMVWLIVEKANKPRIASATAEATHRSPVSWTLTQQCSQFKTFQLNSTLFSPWRNICNKSQCSVIISFIIFHVFADMHCILLNLVCLLRILPPTYRCISFENHFFSVTKFEDLFGNFPNFLINISTMHWNYWRYEMLNVKRKSTGRQFLHLGKKSSRSLISTEPFVGTKILLYSHQ